jgi:PPOX class probable F420-dependent enzyme
VFTHDHARPRQPHRRLSEYDDIARIPQVVRRRVSAARVAYFATAKSRTPALVPVCFVLLGNTVYHAIDAKPKSVDPMKLRRVRNVRANPNAAILVDHYEEDWRRLWFVLVEGRARVLLDGLEQRRAIAALRRKYRQYRITLPLAADAPVIALDVERLRQWPTLPSLRVPC